MYEQKKECNSSTRKPTQVAYKMNIVEGSYKLASLNMFELLYYRITTTE